ncbi:helix-turn-helix domain-containing protein [Enterococcus pallens]|uniref:OmpR/PhoB-type domain-containing protein n=1 Tax=Enterococcus pallens ATCC BAA-351 TaxID=1158607 RepID=R2S0C1_9ENTE|nr:helix-turn-helix domain-containing protein [Enterococcus pallens]EOH86261.1 hypothetical protein UAU_05282 [Enterococcus pallens ATCC BAA-351]EOU09415.1 hypothetical protein I588_05261 [Enterococcus pallens ATCC BAA-351]MBO1340269.1 helix-turn-helix domain-containing protein [Enterococcus sp. 665A]OJG76418.1 hypothetical protein RV10_GL003746 [Enterococcus pallens]
MKILVLTKNVLAEKEIQQQLQELDHEVFCSSSLFYKLMNGQEIKAIEYIFDTVIPGVTITNLEVEKLGELIGGIQLEQVPIGLSKDQLREKLYLAEKEAKAGQADESAEQTELVQDRFMKHLSKNESILFQLLLANKGVPVSREESCRVLWECEPTNSCLSQLSSLSKRLRQKADECKVGYSIQSLWGKGYVLNAHR